MGLFDTIVGGSSSPVFLSYQRRNKADFSPLLKYGDYRSKLAQQAKGTRPDIKPTDIKEGLSYTDVAYFENMQNQGMKEVQNVFNKYGNDYAFAVTTPEFKKAVAKVDIPTADIIRLKEEKDKWDQFKDQVSTKEAGDLVYTGNKGLVGAFGAYDPKAKKWVTTSDALQLRQTNPNYAYQVNPDFQMTSTLKKGEDTNKELDDLFGKAKVSKSGTTYQSVAGQPWANSVAVLLNNMHVTGGGNKQAVDDATNFLISNISEDSKVGMFNEFRKSDEYNQRFKEKELSGKLDAQEVAGYFMNNYMPQYIFDRAKVYYQTESDMTLGTSFIEKDLAGKAKEDAVKISVDDATLSGSQTIFNRNKTQVMSFGMGEDKDGAFQKTKAINTPTGDLLPEQVDRLQKTLLKKDPQTGTIIPSPVNVLSSTGIGPNGQMMNFKELANMGFTVDDIMNEVIYMPEPTRDSSGNYIGLDEKNFIKAKAGGEWIKGSDGKFIYQGGTGEEIMVPDPTKVQMVPYFAMTISADVDDVPSEFNIMKSDDAGTFRPEDANQSWLNALTFGIGQPFDSFTGESNQGLVTETDGRVKFKVYNPYSKTMHLDPGKKNEPNYQTEKILQGQQDQLNQENSETLNDQ